MNVGITTKIRTEIRDAKTGRTVKRSPWLKNLVLDQGLNALAQSSAGGYNCSTSGFFAACLIGSGTNPNSTASGAITFTQSGTTITASAPFFTSGMVGQLFKYGTGTAGAEYYITAFTNNTTVTVDTSATVSTPTVATVWNVSQTALQTFLFKTNTYQTSAGSNSTTFSGNQYTHQRTFQFAQQASPYTVNEIGYSSLTSGADHGVLGRVVLPSSDNVGTSNFYVVTIQITFTWTPASPTAVANVGTNINTAGNLAIEAFAVSKVASNGSQDNSLSFVDGNGNAKTLMFATAAYSQNSAINSNGSSFTWTSPLVAGGGNQPWVFSGTRGTMTLTFSGTLSTSGQTLLGIGIGNGTTVVFIDVKFTAGQTAPTGTFQPNTVWQIVYGRTLNN